MATSLEISPQDERLSSNGHSNGLARFLPPALDQSSSLAAADFWHRSAPRRLIATQEQASPERAWREWQRYIATRKAPGAPNWLEGKSSALRWGLPPRKSGEFAVWLGELRAAMTSADMVQSFLAEWLRAGTERRPSFDAGLEYLAVAHALPRLAATCTDELWWGLSDSLHAAAQDAQRASPDWEHDPAEVVVHQLVAGELALTLGFHLPELSALRTLRKTSNSVFSEALTELLDGEGLPHANFLPWWRPLFACWTRAAMLGRKLRKPCWSSEAQTQYEWLVRQSITFSRADGSIVLSDDASREWSPDLFRAALDLAGDDSDCAAADALLPGNVVPGDADFDEDDLPEPSVNSEWSGLAVMATRWTKSAVRLTLTYDNDPMRIELSSGRDILLCGNWEFELTVDGQSASIDDDEWEEICWQSDEDCDFLELAVDLQHGIRLERQMLLGRDDAVLYLADYVLADDGREHDLEYKMHLPLSSSVQFQPEQDTRDGVLVSDKPLAVVIPPALSEWRTDPRGGELTGDHARLTVHRRHHGQRLACPLFFDFRPRRSLKQRTWRQLTVAEMLEIQPPDVAVGYRIQSGKDQWLFYRSLAPAANRTLIGQNIASDFYAGRFLPTGEVDEFIEIEATEE